MTLEEQRDSPQRRKQFLIICTVVVTGLIHTILQSGSLAPISIEETIIEGGTFVYKETKRDYAASGSLEEFIGKRELGLKTRDFVDKLYTIYMDDPRSLGGRQQRFASGFLIRDSDDQDKKEFLKSKNDEMFPPSPEELDSLRVLQLWPKLEYKTALLPTSRAATVQFTYTGGFVSAILLSMRIIPALRKYATDHSPNDGQECIPITVISTCSSMDQVCTHYAPLSNGQDFLLGHPDFDTYRTQL